MKKRLIKKEWEAHPKRFLTGYQGYLQVMDIVIVVTIKYRMSPLWDVGRMPDISLMNP